MWWVLVILIDERAGSRELIPLIPDCVPCYLDAGDVAITGSGPDGDVLIGVEVKKLDDLLKSISSGRLAATQLEPLLAGYYQAWLITIGAYREGRGGELQIRSGRGTWYNYRIGNRPVPIGYLESSLIELQTIGLNHKHAESNEAAAQFVARLARWWGKRWDEHKGLKKFDRSADRSSVRVALMPECDPCVDQMARVFKELPNLGWDRAHAAANHFDSIVEGVNANVHQWSQIPGVGKVIAKAVVEANNRRRVRNE